MPKNTPLPGDFIPGKTGSPPQFQNLPSWHGANLPVLRELEQRLCRCVCRVELFGGTDAAATEHGHQGMAGLLIEEVYEFLSQRSADFPTRTRLGEVVKPTIRLNILSKFLEGKPPRGTDWFRHARFWLKYMLLGDHPEAKGDRAEVFERIDDYFFRNMKPNEPTPYFERARWQHGTPCSQMELAGEIAWFTRQGELAQLPAEAVWASGGPPFFAEGTKRRVAHETAAAIAAGVRVSFVYHSGTADNTVYTNFETFLLNQPDVKEHPYQTLDLASASGVENWWGMCSDLVKYLYLSVQTPDGEPEQALYIVREPQSDDISEGENPIPFASRATKKEQDRFLTWWVRVKHLARSHPAGLLAGGVTAGPDRPDFLDRAKRILGGDILPEDYLPTTPEVSTLVEEELTRLREHEHISVSDVFRVRLVNEWTLQYFYGGQPVACRRTEQGVIVIATGTASIRLLLQHFPRLDQRPGVVITTPALWQPSDPTASPNR